MGSGQNLTPVNCRDGGWGDVCITRVLKTASDGNEVWLRSCVAPAPMTCESGYMDSGENGLGKRREVWTLCCDIDNCNNNDPRDVLTTEAPTEPTTTTEIEETTEVPDEHMKCYFCSSNDAYITEEEKIACETGVGLENNVKDCAGIWGDECITTIFRNTATGDEVWSRDCVAPPPMTCDEGHGSIPGGWVYWRTCCDTDNCNNYDPRGDSGTTEAPTEPTTTTEIEETTTEVPEENLKCLYCDSTDASLTEEEKIACFTGVGLENNVKNCGDMGAECITTVFVQTATGNELWSRDCAAPLPMTCDEGQGTFYGMVYWRACCNEDNCNNYDPRG